MAQIIRLRRGTLAELNSVTLQNGELGVVTGSVVIGDASIKSVIVVGNTDGTNRLPLARLAQGSGSATLAGKTGGANWNDMIYYDTNDYKLQTLHSTNGVTTLNLSGNISATEITGNISGSLSSTGSFGYLNVEGDGVIKGNLTFGDADTDSIAISADITSNLIPNASDTYNLGSNTQRWNDLYLSGSISASGGPVDIDSATTVAIDSTTTTAINATTTLTAKGATGASFGDDTGTWEFDGDGALSETGMTTVSITPSSTLDLDAGGAITIDGSAISLGTDADTAFDIDTSTLDIDASDEITIDAGSSSGISLDASAASNFSTSAGALTLAGVTLDVDATGGAFNIAATAASTMTTSGGALTLDGKTGVDIKEDGTSVITIDTNQDTLFAATGGSTSDPDVEFDGYTRFDGVTEVADSTDSTSVTTGALIIDGGVGIAKSLVVGGNVTAQEFHTEFVSASIVYDSGSTKFGDTIDDVHSFSGSINLSGSFNHNDGNMTITDTLTATNIGAFTSTGAIDFDSQDMTNVDIDSGTIDGTTIGAASHTTIKGTTIDATTDFTIDGLVLTADTITNDAGLSIVVSSGDLTLNPAGNNVLPGGDSEDDLGVSGTAWRALYVDSIEMNGQGAIAGTTHITASGNISASNLFLGGGGKVDFAGGGITLTETSDVLVQAGGNLRVPRLEIDGANDYVDVDTDLKIVAAADITLDPGGNNVKPGSDSADDLGVSGTAWRALYVDSIKMNGQGSIDGATHITGSGNLKISGNVSGSMSTTGSFSDLKAAGAGATVAASSASLVSFRNSANSQFGYLATADTQATTVGVVGYNTSGNLTVSSVIDGGSF